MGYLQLEMSDGNKYRCLVPHDELVIMVETALREQRLITVPLGYALPGNPAVFNPQHVVRVGPDGAVG